MSTFRKAQNIAENAGQPAKPVKSALVENVKYPVPEPRPNVEAPAAPTLVVPTPVSIWTSTRITAAPVENPVELVRPVVAKAASTFSRTPQTVVNVARAVGQERFVHALIVVRQASSGAPTATAAKPVVIRQERSVWLVASSDASV